MKEVAVTQVRALRIKEGNHGVKGGALMRRPRAHLVRAAGVARRAPAHSRGHPPTTPRLALRSPGRATTI